MPWYGYIAYFFIGVFGANGVPHFVQGICGNRFQTPFASPPGKGGSSPTINVIWGWFNFVIAAGLIYFCATLSPVPIGAFVAAALGALLIALWLANHFNKVRGVPPHP
jgi:hypothetical protein